MIARLPIRPRNTHSRRDGRWRRRFALFPRILQLEGHGRAIVWLRMLEYRWSAQHYRWLWRTAR